MKAVASAQGRELWSYRPSRIPHQLAVASLLGSLRFPAQIEIDLAAFRVAIEKAKLRKDSWLFHPCFCALTAGTDNVSACAQMLTWVSRHETELTWRITCDRPLRIWTPEGGTTVPPGIHLSSSMVVDNSQANPNLVPIDLWGLSIGRWYEDMLAIKEEICPEKRAHIVTGTSRLLSAIARLERALPECFDWFRHATRLIIPLVRKKDGKVRSASRQQTLGAIFCDLAAFPDVLEAIIHETAHQHFYLTEMSLPLVGDGAAKYYSPLRKVLRPLRGVFLAYHALLHIQRFYLAAEDAKLVDSDRYEVVQQDLDIARTSMYQGRDDLTEAGREFFSLLEAGSA